MLQKLGHANYAKQALGKRKLKKYRHRENQKHTWKKWAMLNRLKKEREEKEGKMRQNIFSKRRFKPVNHNSKGKIVGERN